MNWKEKVVGILTDKLFWISAAVILGLFFIWRIAKGRQQKSKPTVPDYDPTTIDYLSEADKGKAESIADALFKDMDGVNTNHNNDLFRQYLESSDAMFVAVYSIFNQKYQAASGQTLKQWFQGESNWLNLGADWITSKNSIIARMDQLKLT